MDCMKKEQVQDILESIVPSDWIQDTEEDLENVKMENVSDVQNEKRNN